MSQPPKIEIIHEDHHFRHTVLWVSRHNPLPAQIRELKRKLGAIRIVMLSGVVPNAEYVANIARQYSAGYVVPVLPLSFIARLVELSRKYGFIVLFAEMNEIIRTTDREEAEKALKENIDSRTLVEYSGGVYRVWEFTKFSKVVEVKIVTEEW